MSIDFGTRVEDFTARTTAGNFRFHDWLGNSWAALFVHPAVKSPAGSTELAELARAQSEFAARHVLTIALAPGRREELEAWLDDIEQTLGARPQFPLIADPERDLLARFAGDGADNTNETAVHPLYVIGPDKTVRASLQYPASSGYAVEEILRLIDALLLGVEHGVATPANWRPGDDVIILPSVAEEDAERRFPGGWRALRDYLRIVPEPR